MATPGEWMLFPTVSGWCATDGPGSVASHQRGRTRDTRRRQWSSAMMADVEEIELSSP